MFGKNIKKKTLKQIPLFIDPHLLESDFDFIIISDHFKVIFFYKRMPLIYDLWDEVFDIEPLCYTKEEFQKKKNQLSIVSEALKEGITV